MAFVCVVIVAVLSSVSGCGRLGQSAEQHSPSGTVHSEYSLSETSNQDKIPGGPDGSNDSTGAENSEGTTGITLKRGGPDHEREVPDFSGPDREFLPLKLHEPPVLPNAIGLGRLLDAYDPDPVRRSVFRAVHEALGSLRDGTPPVSSFRTFPGRLGMVRLQSGAEIVPFVDGWYIGDIRRSGSEAFSVPVLLYRDGFQSVIGTVMLELHGSVWYILDMIIEFDLLDELDTTATVTRWEPGDEYTPRPLFQDARRTWHRK
jgi:hypothetical protein